jgi:large subunit ribosomal protein L2
MPVKTYRPTTPTRRFQTVISREDITKQTPEKSLVKGKKRTGGRQHRPYLVAFPRRRA